MICTNPLNDLSSDSIEPVEKLRTKEGEDALKPGQRGDGVGRLLSRNKGKVREDGRTAVDKWCKGTLKSGQRGAGVWWLLSRNEGESREGWAHRCR